MTSARNRKHGRSTSFGKRNVFRLDLNECKESFCRRGRGRSFCADGLKTEKAREPTVESLVRGILAAESIRSRAESMGGEYRKRVQEESTGREYRKRVWEESMGREYGKRVREESMGGEYGKRVWEESMGGEYGRRVWEESTGRVWEEYRRRVGEENTGREYGKRVREESTGRE